MASEKKGLIFRKACVLWILLVFFFQLITPPPAQALPTDAQVISGEATFEQTNLNTLNITASDQSILEFASFNIGMDETVNFILPNLESFSLSRVIGSSPTEILGTLTANGNIILLNSAGIFIGPSANVTVGGLIASTLDLSNENFLAGNYLFGHSDQAMQESLASVVNEGNIQAREGGFAVLAGGTVENSGTITVPFGTVALASGNVVTFGISPDGLIAIGIDEGVTHQILDADGNPVSDQIKQSGEIIANAGRVILTAEAADGLFDKAVNQEGIIRATRVMERDGVVEIVSDGVNENSGEIHATILDEKGSTFRNTETGTLDGGVDEFGNVVAGHAYYDNLDGAADISGSIGSNQTDTGDLVVTGNITLTANNLTFTADSDNSGTGGFSMNSGTQIDGSGSNFNLTIQTSSTNAAAQSQTAGNLRTFVNMGSLTLDRAGAATTPTYTANNSITSAAGTFTLAASTLLNMGANALSVKAFTNNGTFTAPSTTLTVEDTFNNAGAFTHNSGTVTFLSPGPAVSYTITTGGATFNNVTFDKLAGGTSTFTLADSFTVAGTLSVQNNNAVSGNYSIVGSGTPTITVSGALDFPSTAELDTVTFGSLTNTSNFTVNLSGATSSFSMADSNVTSDANITFSGTGTQNITHSAGTISGDADTGTWTINKASGAATQLSNLTISGTAKLDISLGTHYTNSFNLVLPTGASFFSNTGTLRVQGAETLTFTKDTDSGTVEYVGDGGATTYASLNYGNTYNHLTINSTSGNNVFSPNGLLTVNGNLTISSGVLDIEGQNLTLAVASVFANDATLRLQGGETFTNFTNDTNSGTVEYDGAGTYATLRAGNNYYNLTISGAGSFTAAAATDVNNNFTQSAGTFVAPSTTMNVGGNFAHSAGTFTHNSGTVTLDGANQQISGSTTFNNLNKTVASADTLTFTAGTTQTISGATTLKGTDASSRLSLRSSSTDSQWSINPAVAGRDIQWVDVKDSNNTQSTRILPTDSVNSGNNTNWFPADAAASSNTSSARNDNSVVNSLFFSNPPPSDEENSNSSSGFDSNDPSGGDDPGGGPKTTSNQEKEKSKSRSEKEKEEQEYLKDPWKFFGSKVAERYRTKVAVYEGRVYTLCYDNTGKQVNCGGLLEAGNETSIDIKAGRQADRTMSLGRRVYGKYLYHKMKK